MRCDWGRRVMLVSKEVRPDVRLQASVRRACDSEMGHREALAEGLARAYRGSAGYMLGVWAPPASNASTNIDPYIDPTST